MSFRPYPDVDRALRQVARGRRLEPPSEFQLRLAEGAGAALEAAGRAFEPFAQGFRTAGVVAAAPPVDEYRLSSRPRIVGGGA